MRVSFLLRILFIGLLFHLYVGLRLLPDLPVGPVWRTIGWLWLLASLIVIPVSARLRNVERTALKVSALVGGLLEMGFFSSLLTLTFARDLMLLALAVFDMLAGRNWLEAARPITASAVLGLSVVASAWAVYCARRVAPLKRVVVPIENLPAGLEGFTIVQISDIHVGPTIRRGYLEGVVKAVNAQQADMVAVTGDAIDGPVARLREHTAPFGDLRARHGVFYVTGNPEYYSGAAQWVDEFRRLGLTVLLNEHVVIEHRGAPLVIAGITDYTAHHYDPNQRSDPRAAKAGAPQAVSVLLAHQPLSAPAAAEVGFTLQLSGHTHGGQLFPWSLVVKVQQPFVAGLGRLGRMWVYTSRGTGYWGPPMRLFAPSEITRLTLVRAAAGA